MKPYFEDESVTIYHGDSRELLPMMPRVDLVLTDPPYGINKNHRLSAARGNLAPARNYGFGDWDRTPIDQVLFDQLISFAPQAIIWGGNFYATPRARCWLIWEKERWNGHCPYEIAFTTLEGDVRLMRFRWNGFMQEPGIHKQIREHLTEKPIPLMRWCIGLAKDAQSLIDPFMGSGTTLRAAKDCGIKAIGIDIEERYCEIAARRMAQEVLSFEAAPEQASAAGLFE